MKFGKAVEDFLYVFFRMVWYGLVWFGTVCLFGLVWYGLVWFGLFGLFLCFLSCLLFLSDKSFVEHLPPDTTWITHHHSKGHLTC